MASYTGWSGKNNGGFHDEVPLLYSLNSIFIGWKQHLLVVVSDLYQKLKYGEVLGVFIWNKFA